MSMVSKHHSKKTRKQKGGNIESKSYCQCKKGCREEPMPGSTFCKIHIQGCNRVSPVNGSEPIYDPDAYNNYGDLQNNHNCYAYAFDIKEDLAKVCENKKDINGNCSLRFHQPGYSAGFKRFHNMDTIQCPDITARILADVPGAKIAQFEEKCPIGSSKIALVIDDKRDYHFYRQDRGGMWSHKPGSGKVTNKDAKGNLIYDPALADRNYTQGKDNKLNYKYFCTYMCVPRGEEGKRTFKMTRGGRRSSLKRSNLKRSNRRTKRKLK
jgi:hypothetical protein